MSASPVRLVHGAWSGAWAWGYVQAELEKRGVTSVAIDLPRASRRRRRWRMMRRSMSGEPAVVVGHSYAGVVITEASAGTDKVSHLVYVCAILPQEGESTFSLMGEDPTPGKIGDAIRATDDGLSTLDPAGAKEVAFNDVIQEQADPIIAGLGTHRLSVFGEAPTQLEHPSTYILTTDDRIFRTGAAAPHSDERHQRPGRRRRSHPVALPSRGARRRDRRGRSPGLTAPAWPGRFAPPVRRRGPCSPVRPS